MAPPKEDRPETIPGITHRINTGYGKMYVNVTLDEDDQPFEVFVNMGDSGGFAKGMTEAIGKLASAALRSGVDPEDVADALMGIRMEHMKPDNGDQIKSVPDGIGIAIQRTVEGKMGEPVRGDHIDGDPPEPNDGFQFTNNGEGDKP